MRKRWSTVTRSVGGGARKCDCPRIRAWSEIEVSAVGSGGESASPQTRSVRAQVSDGVGARLSDPTSVLTQDGPPIAAPSGVSSVRGRPR